MSELLRRHSILLRAAQERGDLYAEVNLEHMLYPSLAWGPTEVDKADWELRHIMARWSQRGFHLQHHNALFAHVMVELYRSHGAEPCTGS